MEGPVEGGGGGMHTENVGFGKRFLALLLDMVIFGLPMNILQGLIFGGRVDSGASAGIFVFSVLTAMAYYVGMWAYADGATIGKKILKIRIVRNDGSPLTLKRALGRYFSYVLASIPLSLGLLWVVWDKEKRGWHDRLADTKVIPAV